MKEETLKFKASKPDIRIVLLGTAAAIWLGFYLHTTTAMLLYFAVLDGLLFLVSDGAGKKVVLNALLYIALQTLVMVCAQTTIALVQVVVLPFLMILIRIYPVMLVGQIFLKKTPVNELMYTLEQMHVPMTVLIPVMVIYRYIPTLIKEIKIIRAGMKMRGIECQIRHPVSIVTTVNGYMTALISRSEKLSEELAAASICKGLSTRRKRSLVVEQKCKTADVLILGAGILWMVGLLLLDRHLV